MLNGCTTMPMLSLLLWIAWRMDLRNDFNLVKFHIHPVTFIALTLSSRYCRLHECLWPVVHRQGCGRVELGSFWRLKASLDTKKQISSVLEDLLFDAISVCVCVFCSHQTLWYFNYSCKLTRGPPILSRSSGTVQIKRSECILESQEKSGHRMIQRRMQTEEGYF